jgi:hypothetical protein
MIASAMVVFEKMIDEKRKKVIGSMTKPQRIMRLL